MDGRIEFSSDNYRLNKVLTVKSTVCASSVDDIRPELLTRQSRKTRPRRIESPRSAANSNPTADDVLYATS
eukprot:3561383-Pyramimonas_sp.AAC.1